MPRTYSLIRPIFGFWADISQVVTIPVGAKVKLLAVGNNPGVCPVSWDSRLFLAFGDDIRQNGVSEGPVGDLPRDA